MIVDTSQPPQATILIATKNRKDDLRKAILSSLEQTAEIEIIVMDDASDDGTAQMVRAEFPQVRLERREISAGYIPNRNLGVRLARAPYVVSIDDDTTFCSPDTIEQTLRDLSEPHIAAIAMPLIHSSDPQTVVHQAPDRGDVWVSHRFTGAAVCLRRDVFLGIGGFRTSLVHFGEEDELCLRLLNRGYVTRVGTATPAYHDYSLVRNRPRERYYASRNVIFWSWMNAPGGVVAGRMLMQTLRELWRAAKQRMPGPTIRGLWAGYRDSLFGPDPREPVSLEAWKLWRELRARGPLRLQDIRNRLPNLAPPEGQDRQLSPAAGDSHHS